MAQKVVNIRFLSLIFFRGTQEYQVAHVLLTAEDTV